MTHAFNTRDGLFIVGTSLLAQLALFAMLSLAGNDLFNATQLQSQTQGFEALSHVIFGGADAASAAAQSAQSAHFVVALK